MVLFPRKNVGRVTILLFCMFSDHALYLYQFFVKISQKVSKLLRGYYFQTEIFKEVLFPEKCRSSYSS